MIQCVEEDASTGSALKKGQFSSDTQLTVSMLTMYVGHAR